MDFKLPSRLSNFREKDVGLPGHGHLDVAPIPGALDNAACLGVQADGVLVKVPAQGGVIALHGPEAFSVGLQFQREDDPAFRAWGHSLVSAHRVPPLAAAAG